MPRAFLVFARWGSSLRGFPQLTGNCPNPEIEEKHENRSVDGHARRRRFLRRLQQEGRDDARPRRRRRAGPGDDHRRARRAAGCGAPPRPRCRSAWPPPSAADAASSAATAAIGGRERRFEVRSARDRAKGRLRAAFFMGDRSRVGRLQPSRSQSKPAHRIGDDDRPRPSPPQQRGERGARQRRAGCSRGSGARRRRAAAGRWRSARGSRPRWRC